MLAILVVVVTVAFLTGATLVVLAAGTQTTTLAEEYDAGGQATYYETMAEARAAADDDALVVPIASVTEPNGTSAVVAGVPCERAREFREKTDYSVPCPPDAGATSGAVESMTTRHLDGANASRTVRIAPHGKADGLLPPYWYVADDSVVNRLGRTGVFVVDATPHAAEPSADGGTPLRSVLPFFLTGIQQVITVLGVTAVGTSVLVGVTVYGVTRMHTRDRRRTIRVVRATGGVPRTLLRLYGIRAGALTAVGTALGYAVGVVATNVVVNTAIYLGVPTSLTIRVTQRAATILLPLYAVTIAIGAAAGVLAAWHITRRPPTPDAPQQQSSRWSVVGDVFGRVHRLTLLDWRALLPSVVPLAAFVTVVVLIASITGVVAPLVQTSGTTITDSNANHPIASRVPTGYATALEDRGMTASPEILAFGVHDGEPMVVRGVRFASFARVSDARLVRGRRPDGPNEAVVGADLARTHDLSLNDSVTLGGSTKAGLDRVKIVGTYAAPGPFDDQLLVTLPTARHLARVDSGMVQMVRTDSRIQATGKTSAVVGVSVPTQVPNGTAIPVRVHLQNLGSERANSHVSVRVGDRQRERTVSVEGGERRTVVVRLPTKRLGRQQVVVANRTRTVRVVPRDTVELHGVPERAPPNSAPLVRVTDVAGNPVRNATVTVGDNETTTGTNGTARVQLGAPGNATIRATAGNGTATETVRVSPSAQRSIVGQLRVQPRRATILGQPTAILEVTNPWNETLTRSVTITAGTNKHSQQVRLAPGQRTTVSTELDPAAPGSHPVRATVDGRIFDETTYRIVGDDRIVSALATSGETGSTGISRAISTAFGNLDLLIGVFVCLAGLMTVGSTTATVAYTVHSRRRVVGVHRATGASPVRIVTHILTDALAVGGVATVVAFAVAIVAVSLLAKAGLLVLYGVRITPSITPRVAIGVVAAGVGVMCLSAALVAGALVRVPPESLLSDRPPQTHRPKKSQSESDE